MFSIKNAVYVALMQVGVVVFGVLVAGLWMRLQRENGMFLQPATVVLAGNSFFLLVIPMVWITVVSFVNNRPEVSDGAKNLALLSGILVLIALGIFVLYADLGPLLGITWHLSEGGEM